MLKHVYPHVHMYECTNLRLFIPNVYISALYTLYMYISALTCANCPVFNINVTLICNCCPTNPWHYLMLKFDLGLAQFLCSWLTLTFSDIQLNTLVHQLQIDVVLMQQLLLLLWNCWIFGLQFIFIFKVDKFLVISNHLLSVLLLWIQ